MRGAGLLLTMFLLAPTASAEDASPRVVSMNLCADELVLRLADRAQVASVTWLAHDSHGSNVWRLAQGVGVNHGLAEEVLRDRPDLVIAGAYTTRTTIGFLRRLAIPVLELGVPQTLEETYRQIDKVALALGRPERGAAMIAAMREALDGGTAHGGAARPRAFVLRPNGFTVGPGSLVDAVLTRAGLANAAAELDLGGYGQVPLEIVATGEPHILVVDADERSAPALASELLRHPVLMGLGRRLQVVALPSRLWTCAGPALVDAVAVLEAAGARSRAAGSGG